MNATDFQQTQQTNRWLKSNGVNVAHIYVGTAELFQATKLATNTLREHGRLLGHNEASCCEEVSTLLLNKKASETVGF